MYDNENRFVKPQPTSCNGPCLICVGVPTEILRKFGVSPIFSERKWKKMFEDLFGSDRSDRPVYDITVTWFN